MFKFKLAGQFITLTVGILTVITIGASVALIQIYQSNLNADHEKSVKTFEKNVMDKGTLLADFLAKISAEALMSKDLYTLGNLAKGVLKDNDIASLKIVDRSNSALVDQHKNAENEIIVERVVVTDKERLGIEKEMGKIILGIDTKTLDEMKIANAKKLSQSKTKAYMMLGVFCLFINTLVGVVIYIGFKKVVLSPISLVSKQLKDISEGDGDLTKRLNYNSNNEIGELSKWFEKFVQNLQKIIADLANQANILKESAGELNTKVSSVAGSTQQMSQSAKFVENTASDASKQINDVNSTLSSLSESVGSITKSTNEITLSLNEVAKSCMSESQLAVQANDKAKEAQIKIQQLKNSAQEIGVVIDVIKKIADKTNLLSLNATIEAASAGEAGKGFAIVAGEVKELASQTGGATKEIEAKINDIQKNTDSAVSAMEDIAQVIEELNQISLSVASAVEEQSVTMKEVNNNVNQVSEASTLVSGNLNDASNHIIELKDNIVQIASSLINNGGEMDMAESRISGLDNLVNQLQTVVQKFKY